jgi:HPt (histidine-containing phosphotransfer) domain-containing protein
MIDNNLLIKQLLNQCNQDSSLASMIFDKLFEEIPEQLKQIEEAIHANDFSAAEQTAHTLHGSIRFCGFTVFQEDAQALETALQKQEPHSSRHYYSVLYDKLTDFLARQESIKQTLEHKKSP